MPTYGLQRIGRAGGREAAGGRCEGGDSALVEEDGQRQQEDGEATQSTEEELRELPKARTTHGTPRLLGVGPR